MPELPDIEAYLQALRPRIIGQQLQRLRLLDPFVLRTVTPKPGEFEGKTVTGVRRIGKRIVIEFEGELFAVIHLMIAGRLRWLAPGSKPPPKISHASFELANGVLALTETSPKKRASIHLVHGEAGLAEHDRCGVDVLHCTPGAFEHGLRQENRTLKRALTNPSRFDGIGNAFSDEILHAARLSPIKLTSTLSDEEVRRLLLAAREVLSSWTERLCERYTTKFPGPGEVTAFRPEFAVHGKFGQPCPVCGKPVQRIRYADNETNYCAVCQNDGRILADRALSRLLKEDWPRSFDED